MPIGDGPAFSISHQPDGKADWLELLCHGLTFDCHGLAPGRSVPMPDIGGLFGFSEPPSEVEAIALCPGPHLAGGGAMLPVVRAQVALALRLAALPGLVGVSWQPANCLMEADYFRRIARDWLDGGAFPGLGLTSLSECGDGAFKTVGLGFLIGQEVVFDLVPPLQRATVARIAVRLIHELVTHGRLLAPRDLVGPWGEALRAVPEQGGSVIRVSYAT